MMLQEINHNNIILYKTKMEDVIICEKLTKYKIKYIKN